MGVLIVLIVWMTITTIFGYKFLSDFTEFYLETHASPEVRARRERERAIQANIKFYNESYPRMLDLLKDTWYVVGAEMIHGGIIEAVNKKYPNVWMSIDLSYDEFFDDRKDFVLRPEFYIDDNHLSMCQFGFFRMLSDDENERKSSLESFNKLVEMSVKDYIKTNNIKLKDGEFTFSFTDDETKEWMTGSLEKKYWETVLGNIMSYAYILTTTEYVSGSFADPTNPYSFSRTKMTTIELNDKQKRIISILKDAENK